MKLGILISHPIQYLVPFFRVLAKTPGLDIVVFYTWNFGVEKTMDPEFGKEIKWDIPLLEGYRSIFLSNFSPKPSSGFWGQINPGIIPALRREKCDALLLYGWNSFTNWLAFAACILLKIRIFLRGESPWNQEIKKTAWKRSIKRILLWPLFSFTTAFLYIGEQNKEFYLRYGVPVEKLVWVPYAVDNERLMSAASELIPRRLELRRKLLDINDDGPIILFSGKFIHKKRPLNLLHAFEKVSARLKKNGMSAHLVFVGDGVLRQEIEEQIKKREILNVHLVGFQNQTQLPAFYAMADLFILPSGEGETWGLVVNEAMCFSLPIIVSDSVGCGKDLVREGGDGFVVPLDGIDALAAQMEKVLKNVSIRKNFGEESFKIIQPYSFKVGAEKIKQLLTKV